MNQALEAISQKENPHMQKSQQKISQKTSQSIDQSNRQFHIHPEKNGRKISAKPEYKEKRLILQHQKFIENLNLMQIRDQINDSFF